MNVSIRTRTKFRSGQDAIPYTKEAIERDLERVQEAWDDSRADRRRDSIYGYLRAVYDLVAWWSGGQPKGVRLIECAKLSAYAVYYFCHARKSMPQ
jgi:hypothetical protein